MPVKLGLEARMTIKELDERGWSRSAIARTLGVTEGTVRYHLGRQQRDAGDGRAGRQPFAAARHHDAVALWLAEEGAVNLAALHAHLVEEYDYGGSVRSVQRYVRAHFPAPKRRARRRVETPPGAQGQVDWAVFSPVLVADRPLVLYAFHLTLSWSRYDVVVWSEGKDQLAWHAAHNGALRRIEGVPATLRVDNEKTAVSRGAGAWGEINPAYRRYAQAARFHVDACPPRRARYKGKVERRIRDQRLWDDPRRRHWHGVNELQDWTDERMARSAHRRICPITGTSVWEAYLQEKPHLGSLPMLPEPFDIVVHRQVGQDCTVRFEGRSYSVPFRLIGRSVEVRGCAGVVQMFADGGIVATHPRGTPERLLIDPEHFEGDATERVLPPPPLGRMGQRLQQIAAMPPEARPLDLYAALAEVAR